jgi:hypothetical protein
VEGSRARRHHILFPIRDDDAVLLPKIFVSVISLEQ